ncbi:hypothetical protein E2562_003398 [Oryza meyeriana var. granulata]|uniref:Uncharacterized protein n=1 Tax=Oryza meyeriana var. granulata TaxID=110450 RepID=A0A6G1EEI8_9ORYZ|nr:hypothetical protein E2562_003398 [Oryza meyeriana var. granulata]
MVGWCKRYLDQVLDNLAPSCLGIFIKAGVWWCEVIGVATCIGLSLERLKKQDFVEPKYLGYDDHQNIGRSLNIFYGLVFAQGIIFISKMASPWSDIITVHARFKYKLFEPSGIKILFRYRNNNYLEFITGNVCPTLNTALVTFAKNLAVSNSVDDQLAGVRAMDGILRSVKFRNLALMRLRASMGHDDLGRLVDMLGLVSTTEEQHIRGHAARVVLKLSPDLLVQSCPQILSLISSSLLTTSNKRLCKMDYDLVWFGLRILDKLTDNPENCRKAKDEDGDLLPTIIDLTNLCGHGRSTISDSWIEQEIIPLLQKEDDIPPPFINKIDQEIIFGMALNILSKLVAAPGAAGVDLRKETSKNLNFLTNTGMILEHVEATRVISCLAVDKAAQQEFGIFPEIIKKLKDRLLSKTPHKNLIWIYFSGHGNNPR